MFTKEMKEFPYKLSASGWDLGYIKKLPATGFSGINNSQYYMNALVLDNLMWPENSVTLLSV
ncbi:unnamed protein product [Clonostachys solani]|uniref:Uncharacterized protein n=1 Tax=Clonostachys solani TaxID=160281 RepID=A0A9N9W342_9HYPO|nr:unnamed protein product [Clonostachys solani]